MNLNMKLNFSQKAAFHVSKSFGKRKYSMQTGNLHIMPQNDSIHIKIYPYKERHDDTYNVEFICVERRLNKKRVT